MGKSISTINDDNSLYQRIAELISFSKSSIVSTINTTIVNTYYEIGKAIVENEQGGKERAEYGQKTMKNLGERLTKEFGKGFSKRNLEQMRKFYLTYFTQITQTVSAQFKLSWSHYQFLMGIEDPLERHFYEIEAENCNWSLRELRRQFNTSLYERLALSKNKEEVLKLSQKGQIIEKPQDLIKDPYIVEFLGFTEQSSYSESKLEEKIIDKLQNFLLELGKGYTFAGRQQRISIEDKHFHIDLVFYNRYLQCFVLIDLKIGELTHQDLGQMQMYVNYYDRFVKLDHENKTIGIVLCKKKSDTLVEITLPENNTQIFASKYQTILPNKEELKKLIIE